MARWPEAIWQPVSQVGGALNPQSVTLHHQAGNGNPAGIYESRHVSAHFWIPKRGTPYQHVDTSRQSWHGIQHNQYSLGVETEGCGLPPHAEPLTEQQLDCFGRLMAWANATHGIPLVLSESVTTPGLNYHRCQGGPNTGCPCQVRVDARSEILRRAGAGSPAVPAGSAPSGGQEDSAVTVLTAPGRIDMFCIGTDQRIYQAWGADYNAMMNATWAPLGNEANRGKTVSASWSPDYGCLYVAVHGTDDRVHVAEWNGKAWSPFRAQEHGALYPT